MAGKCHTPWKVRPFPATLLALLLGAKAIRPSDSVWLHSQRKRAFLLPFFATAGKEQEPLVPREEPIVYREQGILVSGSEGNSLTYKNRRDVLPPVPDTANEAV